MRRLLSTLFALKFIVVLGIVGGTMIWVGVSKIRNAQQGSPKIYDKVEDVRLNGDKWITIKNGSLHIAESVYLDDLTGKKIDEIFIPLNSSDAHSPTFYLCTKDSRMVSIFNLIHALSQSIETDYMSIRMGKKDPGYLKLLKKTIPEIEKQIQKSEAELEFYRKKHAAMTESVSGTLDLDSKEKYRRILGENAHIIMHNEKPAAGFYAWFLAITGSILSLLAILSLLGFFTKTTKHEPKS